MKVHLIRKETIEEFVKANSQSRVPLTEWLTKIKKAEWDAPEDIQAVFQVLIYWEMEQVGLYSI